MKYFALLKGGDVRPAPGAKRIPKSEVATLFEAREIVEKAREEAEQMRIESDETRLEKEKEGYDAGFQKGLEKLNEHIVAIDSELKTLRHDLQHAVLPLALKTAKKIVGAELEQNPDCIVSIVTQAVKRASQCRHIRLFVNKEDVPRIENERESLKRLLEHVELLTIEGRGDIEPGSVRIETEKGIINASLDNQWRALEGAFEAFIKRSQGGNS